MAHFPRSSRSPRSSGLSGSIGALALALGVFASVAAPSLAGCSKSSPSGQAAPTYSTKGTIKSFGPDKKMVNIAHEAIPNYMAAMTMSFEPQSPSQLDGLAAGDKVTFTFKDEGGKRTITDIKKAP